MPIATPIGPKAQVKMQEQLTLKLLNRISDELNKDLDPDNMLRRVLDLTVSHLNANTGSVMLFDQYHRVSASILQQEVSGDRASHIVGTVLTEGFAGWVLKNREGGIIFDTISDGRWVDYPNQPYVVRSVIGTPLRRRKRILGVLTLVHGEPDKFQESDLPLLNAIAGQAAIALENAQLFRATEQEGKKLSAVINSTQDAVMVTTLEEHKLLLLNPAAQEMLRVSNHLWESMSLLDLTQNAALLKLMAPNSPNVGEVPLPDGRTMWANITKIPGMGQVTVLRDVSVFKALDKMKRDFVTAFTHDLRTPLATVKGYIELVRMDGPLTVRQEEDLVGITRAADSMKTLIEDLLELSRLERLEELPREDIQLEETVQESIKATKPQARARQIELVLERADKDLVIDGNAVLLSRAVGNLVDNAIKYTPEGGKVQIKLAHQNGNALIKVIDNGPGIRARDLPRVFEKFYRARPELDDVPGSGLGLSIVKTITEQHGGQVWAESEPNEGSTFTISLPILEKR